MPIAQNHYYHGYTSPGWFRVLGVLLILILAFLVFVPIEVATSEISVHLAFTGHDIWINPLQVWGQPFLMKDHPNQIPEDLWIDYIAGWLIFLGYVFVAFSLKVIYHRAHLRQNGGKMPDPALSRDAEVTGRLLGGIHWILIVTCFLTDFGWLSRHYNLFRAGWAGLPVQPVSFFGCGAAIVISLGLAWVVVKSLNGIVTLMEELFFRVGQATGISARWNAFVASVKGKVSP